MKQFIYDYLNKFCDEIDPLEFYRRIFPQGQLALDDAQPVGIYHGIIIYLDNKGDRRRKNFYDDLSELREAIEEGRDAVLSPVQYHGLARTDKNARYINALTIDLDGIETETNLKELFYQFNEISLHPKPTYIVASGNGVHLYYVFASPVACYAQNMKALKRFKRWLTKRVWNRYATEEYKKPQYEAITQPMRLVGGTTKDGGETRTRVFEVGELVTTEYLDSFVTDEASKIGNLAEINTTPLAMSALLWPDWYERRILKDAPRGSWTCNRGLYDYWIKRISTEAVEGHRYFCIMTLAVYAKKCGIPREELERDARALLETMDELSSSDENRFTEYDIICALEAYDDKYITFPRESIERVTNIRIDPQRRNWRKQDEHLARARAVRVAMHERGEPWRANPKKDNIVRNWRASNPNGTKKQCRDETGLSYPTIRKYWNSEDDFKTLSAKMDEITSLIENMTPEEFNEFRTANEDVINEVLSFYKKA